MTGSAPLQHGFNQKKDYEMPNPYLVLNSHTND